MNSRNLLFPILENLKLKSKITKSRTTTLKLDYNCRILNALKL